jgi:hypothetical protein
LQNRVGDFPAIEGVPVDVAWDIGVGDATSLWFTQCLGNSNRIVGYYENSGEGLRHYTTPSIEWHASVVGQSVMRSGRMTVV